MVSDLALSGANAPALPKGEPLTAHANFISLPRPLPLTDFPRLGEDVAIGDKKGNEVAQR